MYSYLPEIIVNFSGSRTKKPKNFFLMFADFPLINIMLNIPKISPETVKYFVNFPKFSNFFYRISFKSALDF